MLIFLNCLLETSFKSYLASWTQIKLGKKKSFFGMKIIWSILSQVQIQWSTLVCFHLSLNLYEYIKRFSMISLYDTHVDNNVDDEDDLQTELF
jgi:hypothetical protein